MRDLSLRSLLPYGDQAIAGKLKKHVLKPILVILTTYMETRLKSFFALAFINILEIASLEMPLEQPLREIP